MATFACRADRVFMLRIISSLALIVLFALASGACAADEAEEDADPGQLIIYSGRGESLVGPLLERFEELTGIEIKVRYGDTAAMAIAIAEEGSRSPADIYYGQDAGALSFLSEEGLAAQLPADVTAMVDGKFQDDGGRWIATSGRARVLIFSPDRRAQPARLGLRSGRSRVEGSDRLGADERQFPGLCHRHAPDPRRGQN